MKCTILVDLPLVIVKIYFYALEFQEIHKFYTFYPKIFSSWSEGVMKFLVSLSYWSNIPNLVKIGPVVHDDGRQPIAIGHLSDSVTWHITRGEWGFTWHFTWRGWGWGLGLSMTGLVGRGAAGDNMWFLGRFQWTPGPILMKLYFVHVWSLL